RHDDRLGERTGSMLAQHAVVETQGVLAGAAVGTGVVGDPRVDHDSVAGPHRPHLGAHRLHDARPIGTEDVGVVVFVGEPAHDEEIEMVERRRAQRDPYLPRLEGPGGVRDVGELELVEAAGAADHPGAHGVGAARYGMKAGDTICSAPVVGIGTGAPLPAAPTGWPYTRNTLFCTATTSPRRSPAGETVKSVTTRSTPESGVTFPVARSTWTTCVPVRPLSLCSTREAREPAPRKRGADSLLCCPRVTGRWLEPSFDINQIWLLPSRFDTKAIGSPSGAMVGCELSRGSWVSWTASELVMGCRKIWRCPVRCEWNTTA